MAGWMDGWLCTFWPGNTSLTHLPEDHQSSISPELTYKKRYCPEAQLLGWERMVGTLGISSPPPLLTGNLTTNTECYCGPCIHVEVLLQGAEMEALGSPVGHNLPKWDIVGPRLTLFLSHAKAFAQSETIANR